MSSSRSRAASSRQQQTLTEFFSAKKSTRSTTVKQAGQALEKLRQLQAGLEEIKASKKLQQEKAAQQQEETKPKKQTSPAFERYANLLAQRPVLPVDAAPEAKKKVSPEPGPVASPTKNVTKKTTSGSALSRMEAKRAALKSARDKLRQLDKDQAALKEFQATKQVREQPVKVAPAYEKYSYLTVPTSFALPLPTHYEKLLNGFRACDTVMMMFHNRKEICRLDKLSHGVRKMTHNEFGLSQLGKIMHLKPDSYLVAVEQHRFVDSNQKMHHIVTFTNPPKEQNPRFILERRNDFKERLLLRVLQYHQEFLEKEMPDAPAPPVEAMKRWHPKFQLDSIPDIPENELPKIPGTAEVVTANAQDILNKVRGKFASRIEKALETLAEKQKTEAVENATQKKAPSAAPTSAPKSIPGVNQDLLERIRKREAIKMAEQMVMGGEDENERRVLRSLPPLVRAIRQVFLASKKATLLYTDLVAKLQNSGVAAMGGAASAQFENIDNLLKRIGGLAPDWYKPLSVRNASYIKIDKDADVNKLCERIDRMVNEVGSSKGV